MKIGDTIKCSNADELVATMREVLKLDYDCDFKYSKDGVSGYWLEITKTPPKNKKKNLSRLERLDKLIEKLYDILEHKDDTEGCMMCNSCTDCSECKRIIWDSIKDLEDFYCIITDKEEARAWKGIINGEYE